MFWYLLLRCVRVCVMFVGFIQSDNAATSSHIFCMYCVST